MQNKIGSTPDSNRDKIKNKKNITALLLTAVATISAAVGMAKLNNNQMATAHKNSVDTTSVVNEEVPKGQIPLSKGITMPKEYVPQVPKTNGLDAFNPVRIDKSQDWAAVDKATANKPAKPSTARRSD